MFLFALEKGLHITECQVCKQIYTSHEGHGRRTSLFLFRRKCIHRTFRSHSPRTIISDTSRLASHSISIWTRIHAEKEKLISASFTLQYATAPWKMGSVLLCVTVWRRGKGCYTGCKVCLKVNRSFVCSNFFYRLTVITWGYQSCT